MAIRRRRRSILTPGALRARRSCRCCKPLGLRILIEPGRFIVGNAGILVTRVEYVKRTGQKNFVIVDAAMNDLIRPAFYDSYHEIVPLAAQRTAALISSDVVGPICESGDYFAKDRPLPKVGEGDYLALLSAGAYGFVMASNYNSRAMAAEVLVNGNKAALVRPAAEAGRDLEGRENSGVVEVMAGGCRSAETDRFGGANSASPQKTVRATDAKEVGVGEPR